MTEPVATYIYLTDYSDEFMPCTPTLQGWADWLAKPDLEWNRPDAAADGEVFEASTLLVLADVRYGVSDAGVALPPLPTDAREAFLRYAGPDSGWSVDDHTYQGANHPDTPEGFRADVIQLISEHHVPPFAADEGGYVALVKGGPGLRIRFSLTPDGPRCSIEGTVQ